MEAATMLTVVKIGDKLREMRTRRLLTQVQLAEKSGVNQVTIARIERNQVDPRFSTIRKLAKALDVDPIKLIGD
jgi:transcriptional regulator with XRE-family HTH domain